MLNYYELSDGMMAQSRWVVARIDGNKAIPVDPDTLDPLDTKPKMHEYGTGWWRIKDVIKVAASMKDEFEMDFRPAFVDQGGNLRLFKEL
jgi:hypothetical protein